MFRYASKFGSERVRLDRTNILWKQRIFSGVWHAAFSRICCEAFKKRDGWKAGSGWPTTEWRGDGHCG